MTDCKNALRKPGYYVLTRVYLPSGEYHLEPQYIKDVTTLAPCLCKDCDGKEQAKYDDR